MLHKRLTLTSGCLHLRENVLPFQACFAAGCDENFSSFLQEKSQELLGNKDFKETWWCSSLSDLANGKQGSPPQKLRAAAEYKSMFRKNSCSGSGLGLKVSSGLPQLWLEANNAQKWLVTTHFPETTCIIVDLLITACKASCIEVFATFEDELKLYCLRTFFLSSFHSMLAAN